MSDFIVGVDLGQVSDYTAICVVERVMPPLPDGWRATVAQFDPGAGVYRSVPTIDRRRPEWHVRHLERPALGTKYTAVAARAKQLLATPPLSAATPLVIDQTGVGRGVFDLFGQAGLSPWGITITGGEQVARDGRHHRVPKKDLAGALIAAFHGERLKIAAGLPEGATLVNELLNFKVKVNIATGNESFEAWREGVHDDLVLAVAMAVWWGENRRQARATLFGAVAGKRPSFNAGTDPAMRGGWR